MYEISDYNYITSAIGNGIFSGLSLEELWSCISLSCDREQLDVAIAATILLKTVIEKS